MPNFRHCHALLNAVHQRGGKARGIKYPHSTCPSRPRNIPS